MRRGNPDGKLYIARNAQAALLQSPGGWYAYLPKPGRRTASGKTSGYGLPQTLAGCADALMGFVFRDTNANGILDAGEPGVGGITVRPTTRRATWLPPPPAMPMAATPSATCSLQGKVHLEFGIPDATAPGRCETSGIDFPSFNGTPNSGNVQFICRGKLCQFWHPKPSRLPQHPPLAHKCSPDPSER